MAGEHRYALCIITDQSGETPPDLDRRMTVVGQRENPARVLASHPDQIGDPMDEHPGLAGTGTGQHQDVGLLAIVGDDPLLYRVVEALYDARQDSGVVWRANSFSRSGNQRLQEFVPFQAEVVHRQAQGIGHGAKTPLHVLRHDVDLHHLLVVMDLQRLEIRLYEAAPVLAEADRHRRAENRQSLVESDHLLFVQPQERPVQELGQVLCLRPDDKVIFEGGKELAEGRFRQEIRAALPSGRQETGAPTDALLPRAAAGRSCPERTTLFGASPRRLRIQPPQAQAADSAVFAAAIVRETP